MGTGSKNTQGVMPLVGGCWIVAFVVVEGLSIRVGGVGHGGRTLEH